MITQEIKDFIKSNYDISIPPSVPEPLGYHLLVLPLCARKKIGSIYIPDSSEEKMRLASIVALVLAMGPDAYDHERYINGPWCVPGDFVILDRDAGNKFTMLDANDQKTGLRLIADDQVKAKLNSFEEISRVELKL